MASSLNNPAWMEWMTTLMGGVSRHTYAATLPPDRFYCLLDELPLHLIPQRVFKSLQHHQDQHKRLVLNPDCVLCTDGQFPDELESRRELLSGFALQGTMAWVRNRASGDLLPFWLGPELERVVRGFRPNEPVPASILESTQRLLTAAGILIPLDLLTNERADEATRRRDERSARHLCFCRKGLCAAWGFDSSVSCRRIASLLPLPDSHGRDQAGRWPESAALRRLQRAGGAIFPS